MIACSLIALRCSHGVEIDKQMFCCTIFYTQNTLSVHATQIRSRHHTFEAVTGTFSLSQLSTRHYVWLGGGIRPSVGVGGFRRNFHRGSNGGVCEFDGVVALVNGGSCSCGGVVTITKNRNCSLPPYADLDIDVVIPLAFELVKLVALAAATLSLLVVKDEVDRRTVWGTQIEPDGFFFADFLGPFDRCRVGRPPYIDMKDRVGPDRHQDGKN